MARPKRVVRNIDGSVEITVTLQPAIAQAIEAVGGTYITLLESDQDPLVLGSKILMRDLEAHAKLGTLGSLGQDWRRPLQPSPVQAPRNPIADFDQRLLHRNGKRVSGFEGVVAHGSKYLAQGRHPSGVGTIALGAYPTGLEAAIARYRHYVENVGLCYGQAEEEIEAFRKIDKNMAHLPDHELWRHARQHAETMDRLASIFGPGMVALEPGPREPQLEVIRARWAELDTKAPDRAPIADSKLTDIFKGLGKPLANAQATPVATPIDLADEPVKRGRPFKPCEHCGLKLKTIEEYGERYHLRASGERIACVVQQVVAGRAI